MPDGWWWVGTLAAGPLTVVAVSLSPVRAERLRYVSIAAASVLLVAALILVAGTDRTRLATGILILEGTDLLRIDTLSIALLPLAAALWLLTVAVTPRSALGRDGLRRTAIATLLTFASFLTRNPVFLLLLWVGSVWTFLHALGNHAQGRPRRIVTAYLGVSTLLLAVGVALMSWPAVDGTPVETTGLWLIVMAALIRKGIVPFHAWVPEVFDQGRLGPAVLFSAPQVGAYVTAVLVVPQASPEVLRLVAVLALVTAVYGAALALVQTSARRACGYLFVSQSALVMAGLDCTSASALAGGLVLWLSSGLAFAGLARTVLVLEARRGRMDLSRYHGGYQRMPVLAISFLVMGLACTGFPGTLAFAGQEMLVAGAVEDFPVLGFAVVLASALTGLAVVRMYFALFCGRPEAATDPSVHLALRRSETWSFATVVVLLVGFGLFPRLVVDSRFAASEELLRARQYRSNLADDAAAADEARRPAGAGRRLPR